jgi:chloramphenicol-sensitive protein RarD
MPPGFVPAFLAYVIWGLFPLYFHHLAEVPAFEMVLHRSVWSLVFVMGLLALQHRWQWLVELARKPRVLLLFAASALLLSSNWLLYVWAVTHGRVLEASLGYFINPLVNVLLGVLVLRERPRPWQWAAVALAAAGVLWLAWSAGTPPWISLGLAGSFGFYGLLRKTAPLGAVEGLALETLVLAPLAIPALAWTAWHGGVAAHADAGLWAWLLLGGPLTAVPLLLFAQGARRVTMATLGLLQFIAPTLQFALGVWAFNEPMVASRLVGFVMIWLALALYSAESLWLRGRAAPVTMPEA